ncbi:transglycosylase [Burkholderia phage vB_BglM_WTB]
MADEIDKFVLEYRVQTGDSVRRLEDLNDKVEELSEKSQKAADDLTQVGSGADKNLDAAGKAVDDLEKKVDKLDDTEKRATKTQEKSRQVRKGLIDRMREFGKENKKLVGSAKEFSKGATDEFAKVVPGVDGVSTAVRALGAEFTVATLAVSALAIGIKSVFDMRAQYNEQRLEGIKNGVSGIRMEEYQRKFVRNSNGRVTRGMTAEEVGKFSSALSEAYADPTRTGDAARRFRMLGIDVGARGQGVTPTNTALTRLAGRFQGMSAADTQGVAKAIGMNPDFALTLRQLGPSIGKITEMTQAEIDQRQKAEEKLTKFNDSMSTLTENFKEAGNALGEKLLPSLQKVVDLAVKLSAQLPQAGHATVKAIDKTTHAATYGQIDATRDILKGDPSALLGKKGSGLGVAGYFLDWFKDWQAESKKKADQQKAADEKKKADDAKAAAAKKEAEEKNQKTQTATTAKQAQTVAKDADSRNKTVDQLDAQNQSAQQSASAFSEAINLFNGAVTTFANAIDERQAWAAWAGEMGFASGLSTNPAAATSATGSNMRKATTLFDPIFAEAAQKLGLEKYGITAMDLKKQAWVESKLDPNAVSNKGAIGIGQILPENYKRLGITDPRDPRQSIFGMATMMRENMKKFGNYQTALMAYHGGWNQSAWGPKTRAYPELVQGAAPSAGGTGVSIGSVRLRQVQSNLAAQLGVPAEQVMQGRVSKGDLAWKVGQMEAGVQNNILAQQAQLGNMLITPRERARVLQDIRQQQIGLSSLQGYGGVAAGIGQQGPQQITIGERAIQLNILGSGNPQQTADAVFGRLHEGLADIVSQNSNGLHN